jgi:hypothetical protein
VLGNCVLYCKTSGVPCGAESWSQWGNGVREVLKTSAERENDRKGSERVGNDRDRSCDISGMWHSHMVIR